MSKIKDFELDNLEIGIVPNSTGHEYSVRCSIYYKNNRIIELTKNQDSNSLYNFTEFYNLNKKEIISEIERYFLEYPKHFNQDITDETLIEELINDLLRISEIKSTYIDNLSKGYKYLVCVNYNKRINTFDYEMDKKNFMISLKSTNDILLEKIQRDYNATELVIYDSLESIDIK